MKRRAFAVMTLAVTALAAVMLISGFDAAPAFAQGGAAAEPSRIDELAKMFREPQQDTKVGAVEIDQNRQTLEVRDIRIGEPKERGAITVRSLQFYDVDWDGQPAPRRGRIRAREAAIALDESDETMRRLKGAGYDAVVLDADLHFDYDEAREKLTADVRVDFREMGLLTSEFEAGGVTREMWAELTNRSADEEAKSAAVAKMRVEKFSVRYDGPSRRLANLLPVSVQGVTLDITGLEKSSTLPRLARLNIRGLAVDLNAMGDVKDAEGRDALKELGYQSVQANLDYQCTFDDRTQTFDALVNLDVMDMGGLRYEMSIGGLGPLLSVASSLGRGALEPSPEKLAALGIGALAMTVNRASLHYEDHSLMERAIAAEARKKGVTPEQITAGMLDDIETQRREIPEKAAQELFDAAAAFVRKPGVIGVVLKPESPATYAELGALALSGDYGGLVRRLKVRVDSR